MNENSIENLLGKIPDLLGDSISEQPHSNDALSSYADLSAQFQNKLAKLKETLAELKHTPTNQNLPTISSEKDYSAMTSPSIDIHFNLSPIEARLSALIEQQNQVLLNLKKRIDYNVSLQVKEKIHELTQLLNHQVHTFLKPLDAVHGEGEKLIDETNQILSLLQQAKTEIVSWKTKYHRLNMRLEDLEGAYTDEVKKLEEQLHKTNAYHDKLKAAYHQLIDERKQQTISYTASFEQERKQYQQKIASLKNELKLLKLESRKEHLKLEESYELRLIELEEKLHESKQGENLPSQSGSFPFVNNGADSLNIYDI